MDLCGLLYILFLIKLSGTQDLTTVKKISIQKGQSFIIPYLYEQEYPNEYLSGYCHLNTTLSYQQYNLKHVFIPDDKAHRIATLRMDNVQQSGEYLCTIHTLFGPFKQTRFFLEVSQGPSRLRVSNQHLIGSEDDSVTVTCYHHGQVDVTWCKFRGHCIRKTGTLDGVFVQIRQNPAYTTVTMSKLKKENTGWYGCSSGDLQMPVHVTVKQKRSITNTDIPQIPVEATKRTRTAILFLLPVIFGVLLVIIIYAALKLLKLCRERCLQSTNQEAEESQYVIMHRKPSCSHGCAAVGEGTYESMSQLSNIELPASCHKSTCPAVVKQSDLLNVPRREPEYVNVTKT